VTPSTDRLRAPPTVLLIEDDLVDSESIRKALAEDVDGRRLQVRLLVAADLEEARAVCDREPVEAILLDLGQPGTDGIEALDRVLAWNCNVAVVVLTGHDDDDLGYRLLKGGAHDYLPKATMTAALLQRALRYAIARRDIERELREAREVIIEVQRMEAIGQLAGGIAHDFNNLLMIVNGYAENLLRERDHGATTRRKLARIHDAGTRAAQLTAQLLAFSRRQPHRPEVVDLAEVVRENHDLIRGVIGEDVELHIEGEERPWNVELDPYQFEQVLVNLATNAHDALPRGGKVTIRLANLPATRTAGSAGTRDRVLLEFADDGLGMDRDTAARAFEPFFTTKEVGHGTGLGLAMVHGVVRQSGGRVEVRSEAGRGTVVAISLPRRMATGRHPTPSTSRIRRRRQGNATVLLAEDEPDLRELLVEALEEAGYRVRAAADGAETLEIGRELGPELDLLVSDVVMPHGSGPEVARELRADLPDLAVIYLSGHPERAIRTHGLEDDDPLLPKPCPIDLLLAKVTEVLEPPP